MSAAKTRPYLSGFCNPSCPPDSHKRCKGGYQGSPCSCACHTTVDPLTALTDAVEALSGDLSAITDACTDPEGRDFAELLWHLRSAREALQGMERDIEAATARAMLGDFAESGDLRVERSRSRERKAWDHDSWQADVRAKVAQASGLKGAQGVVLASGEVVPASVMFGALCEVQRVHGASAPKTTALRALGLDPEDYAETQPGAWRVKVTRLAAETESEGE